MTSNSISDRRDDVQRSLFAHTPLDLTKTCLRLLQILSVSSDGTIECRLSIHDFEDRYGLVHDPPFYDALSYEWGPVGSTGHWIILNGSHFQIRHNLYCFLRVAYSKLRSNPDLARLIWTDAICIDQENLAERGHQVKQMSRIYKSASTVLVWLGPDIDKHIGPSKHDLAQWTTRMNMEADYVRHEMPLRPGSRVYPAFEAICEQSYWTRMWIIQEIHFAKKALLVTGEDVFAWEPIKRWMRQTQLQVEDILDLPALQVVNYLAKDYTEATLCDLVYAFGKGKCSDIRDRVYAILSLVPGGLWFKVDYAIAEVELLESIIVASYEMKSRAPAIQRPSGNWYQLMPYGLSIFKRKRADILDLSIVFADILKALHVSFHSLDEHLAHRHDLGKDTLMCVETAEQTRTDTSSQCTEHSFTLANLDLSALAKLIFHDLPPRLQPRLQQNLVQLLRPGLDSNDLHRSKCKIMQERTALTRGTTGRNETVTYTADTSLLTHWKCDGTALWMSFHTVMFLARALYTIRNLNISKLDDIATQAGAATMSVDPDGTRHILVDVTSRLADLEF